jgi:molecular chaperone DnaK (HSP70)
MADGLRVPSAQDIIGRARSTAQSKANSDQKTTTSELVIGIDFGTTYTGVAYAISSSIGFDRTNPRTQAEAEALIEKVIVIKNWPNAVQQSAEKTPTVLAYDNGEMIAWGGKVKPSHKIKVAHFKLGLQENIGKHYVDETGNSASLLGGFLRNPNWKHEFLQNKKAIDFTADYLTAVRKYVIGTALPSHYGAAFLNNLQVSYALTVPAIWTDKANDLTRQAAFKAGIPEDRLILISEPEAAALYCATMCTEVDLKDGDRFLVCDAGGGTVVRSFPFLC